MDDAQFFSRPFLRVDGLWFVECVSVVVLRGLVVVRMVVLSLRRRAVDGIDEDVTSEGQSFGSFNDAIKDTLRIRLHDHGASFAINLGVRANLHNPSLTVFH